MKQNNESFEQIILSFGHKQDLHTVFADFLTMLICAFSMNPLSGKSHYEDEYISVINKYDKKTEIDFFPRLLARLIIEMEEGLNETNCSVDVLGNFYESHISHGRKGQYFTPLPITDLMASITDNEKIE